MESLVTDLPSILLFAALGTVVASAVGLVAGTDETATLAPLTLVVALLNVPTPAVFTFFLSSAIAKHITHAIPTTMLGIPGDTMAIPLMREANRLRFLGVPHLALQKMVSSAVIAAFIAVPMSVLVGVLLIPVADAVKAAAPWIFLGASLLVAYFSAGRWASLAALIPFTVMLVGLEDTLKAHHLKLNISFFMGIAVGSLITDLMRLLAPAARETMRPDGFKRVALAAEAKGWNGHFPNPLKVLDGPQLKWTAITAAVSSTTFVFSPLAMTVVLGEIVGSRIKHAYHRLTSVVSVRNGVTEATYIAETLIPLIAFGLPLSPVAVGPAWPLFNAPPRYSIDSVTGVINNAHTQMSVWEFFGCGMVSVAIVAIIAYPFAMNFAHRAASFVLRRISHEAIIATFIALVIVISIWEGGIAGLFVTVTVGLVGGLLSRAIGFTIGVQAMAYYVSLLTVPALLTALS